MRETASEWQVREAAREVALEAMGRIRARLREAEAKPLTNRFYEPEWVTDEGAWPTGPILARDWVPYLLEDLDRAHAEFDAADVTDCVE